MDDTPKYPAPVTDIDALPKNYDAAEAEERWQRYWLDAGVYRFEPVAQPSVAAEDTQAGTPAPPREEIFSIDTPPPTVSGALHIGHVYSYTQTDMNARYRRMTGKRVFYPFGFDDNGLPTERLVEKERGIRAHEVSREEFIAMCQEVSKRYEDEFVELWQSLALSCDWDQFYTTIDDRSRAISQASFIDLYRKGLAYRKDAPTQWDWANKTAIAQAEIEDREVAGHFHYIKFQWADGRGQPGRGEFVIGTTRPELIPACVAVMAHPESDAPLRDHVGNALTDFAGNPVLQRELIGKIAITPLFEVEVPILPSEKADPEKGTGVLMCCTFGDMDDVEHWGRRWDHPLLSDKKLETRIIIGADGRILDLGEPEVRSEFTLQISEEEIFTSSRVKTNWLKKSSSLDFGRQVAGLKIKAAREAIVGWLDAKGQLMLSSPILHTVRFAERGNVEVEILATDQWYIDLLNHKTRLREHGESVGWHPGFMLKRYVQWTEGLNVDWCISRQRHNGVPFPIWYIAGHSMPLVAAPEDLPVNPLTSIPSRQALELSVEVLRSYPPRLEDLSFNEKLEQSIDLIERAIRGEAEVYKNSDAIIATATQAEYDDLIQRHLVVVPDPDVMDTWATSSVTPLLNTHLLPGTEPTARHGMLFPFDMRAQAHDIIRTWAFYTIVKSLYHFGTEYDEASGKWVISSDEEKLRAALPWRDIVISGHGQTTGREKISKSKGHSVTPAEMVEKYSADGLRFWSGSARLGADTVYDEKSLAEGRKLINKLFNATKFALRHLLDYSPVGSGPALSATARPANTADAAGGVPTADNVGVVPTEITYPTDLWLLSRLDATIERATRANEAFEFGEAKQAVEEFFWADLCDNYLELSKGRLYGEPLAVGAHGSGDVSSPNGRRRDAAATAEQLRRSAQATLYTAFSAVLRMFAPVLPHITEECWSWYFARFSDKPSIHLETWPRPEEHMIDLSSIYKETRDGYAILHGPAPSLLLGSISAIRKWKSEQQISIKTALRKLYIYPIPAGADFSVFLRDTKDFLTPAPKPVAYEHDDLAAILGDLLSTANAQSAELIDGPPPKGAVTTDRNPVAVNCELAEQPE